MNLAGQLRIAREACGLTQAEVSQATRIAAPNLSTIESGKVDIRLSTLARILAALQLDVQLVPRTHRITLDEAIAQSQRGRSRLIATGLSPSDPQARLTAKPTRGLAVAIEQGSLDVDA